SLGSNSIVSPRPRDGGGKVASATHPVNTMREQVPLFPGIPLPAGLSSTLTHPFMPWSRNVHAAETTSRLILVLGLLGSFLASSLAAAARPTVLLISIADLRNDLGSRGAEPAKTPHLDRLATTARVFDHHYVHVPTCGASRCALLRGRYPSTPA